MIAVKIRYNDEVHPADILYFLTLSEKDSKQIAGKIHKEIKRITSDKSIDHDSMIRVLVDWCMDEFGERPHRIRTEVIDLDM